MRGKQSSIDKIESRTYSRVIRAINTINHNPKAGCTHTGPERFRISHYGALTLIYDPLHMHVPSAAPAVGVMGPLSGDNSMLDLDYGLISTGSYGSLSHLVSEC